MWEKPQHLEEKPRTHWKESLGIELPTTSKVNKMPFKFWHDKGKEGPNCSRTQLANVGQCGELAACGKVRQWPSVTVQPPWHILCRRASSPHSLFHISNCSYLYILFSIFLIPVEFSRNSWQCFIDVMQLASWTSGDNEDRGDSWTSQVQISLTSRAKGTNHYIKWIWHVWVKIVPVHNQAMKAEQGAEHLILLERRFKTL